MRGRKKSRKDLPTEPQNKGVKIGYVPRQDNAIFARLMDAGKLLFGKITEKEKKGAWVKIYIKVFLRE